MTEKVFSFTAPADVIHACSTLANSFSNSSSSGVGFTKVVHFKLDDNTLECSARTNDGGAKQTFSGISLDVDSGEILIPSGDFVKIASVIPKGGEAEVTVFDDATVRIESEGTSVTCLGIDLDNDYEKPELHLPDDDDFRDVAIPSDLKHALDWVRNSRATGEGSSSFAMSGVLMSLTCDGGWNMMCGSSKGIARYVSPADENDMGEEAVVLPVDHLSSSVTVVADADAAMIHLSKTGATFKSMLDDGTTLYTFTAAMNLPAKDFGQDSLLKQAKKMLSSKSGEVSAPARKFASALSSAVKMSAGSEVELLFEPSVATVSSIDGFGFSTDMNCTSDITPGESVTMTVDGQKLRGVVSKCDGNTVINACSPIGGKIPVFVSDTDLDEDSLETVPFVVEIGH